ncbi:hypothetical protein ACFSKL_22220 [Belliella marina]|uniref:HTH luxR-type domain-containing protein n=1 Tax=Belliella marina TaxID=1644146 RepID=A0ABW4VV02_9BACT
MLGKIKYSLFFSFIMISQVSPVFSISDYQYSSHQTVRDFRIAGKYEEGINLLLDMIEESSSKKDLKRQLFAKIELANFLWIVGRLDECLYYLQDAEVTLDKIDDSWLKSRLYQEYAQYYFQLGLFELAKTYNGKALKFAHSDNDLKFRNARLAYLYGSRSSFFAQKGNLDSAIAISEKSLSFQDNPIQNSLMLKYYMESNFSQDSTEYYLKKVLKMIDEDGHTMNHKFWLLNQAALYYLKNEKLEEAKPLIEKSTQIAENIKRYPCLIAAYTSKAEYYKAMGNEPEEYRYLIKVSNIKDEFAKTKAKGIDLTMSTLIRLNTNKIEYLNKKNSYILIGVVFFVLCVGLLFYFLIEKERKKNKIAEEDVKLMTIERSELLRKVDSVRDEIINLAKNNDPAFVARFKDVYSEWWAKMMELDPSLTPEDLKFCAMLYLNFSTKDIAKFTFVQCKTVQVKKYRLRKKLNIDSSVDLYDWLAKI